MKDFHRSFICRSTETGKKGHKNKQSNKNEACKCYAPFLKLHYYDCPVARKPCPLHGSAYRQFVKDENTEKKENMIISFHPSSKTDRLFRPVKTLLAHCNPEETKVNLEYHSPNNSTFKDGVKHRQVQTNSEEFKNLENNVFVEKTKSFVIDKTNRMKRLKQCFHSPCNSIVERTRSQTTVKEKIYEKFREGTRNTAVSTNIPEEPSDDMYFYEKSKWTSSNKLDSSDWDKSSDDKLESDFVTVTKQAENKIIDHKIYEIKHKKGFGDARFTKLPRQTQMVYSTYNIEKSNNDSTDPGDQVDPQSDKKIVPKNSNDKELVKKNFNNKVELRSSGKSDSSSSGSVYFTPFILIPPGMEDSSIDLRKYMGDMPKEKESNVDEEVQVGDSVKNTALAEAEPSDKEKSASESSSSETSTETKSLEFDEESTSLKTEKAPGSRKESSDIKFIYSPDDSQVSKSKSGIVKENHPSINSSQTITKSHSKSTQMSPPNSRTTNEYNAVADEVYEKKSKPKAEDPDVVAEETSKRLSRQKNNSVQTDPVQKKEISLVYDAVKNVADKIIQTDEVTTRNVLVETMAAKKNKSQMTSSQTAKSVQTSFSICDSQSRSHDDEFAGYESNITFFVTSCTSPSQIVAQKPQWSKCHSDGDIYYKRMDDSLKDNVMCLCENSETGTWNSGSDIHSYEKIDKLPKSIFEKDNFNPIIETKYEAKQDAGRNNVISKGEQTSLSDLSELARMVDKIFNKMSREAFKTCECEKSQKRVSNVSKGIKTDSLESIKKPMRDLTDAGTQTIFKVILGVSEEGEKNECAIRDKNRNVFDDDDEAISLCKNCCKEKNTSVVEISTATEYLEKKEVSTSTETVQKYTVSACTSQFELSAYISKKQQSQSVGTTTEGLENAPVTKEPQFEPPSDQNKQTLKEWSMSKAKQRSPSPFRQQLPKEVPRYVPNKSHFNKINSTTNEPSERRNIRKQPTTDSWKPTDYSILSEPHTRPSHSYKSQPPAGRIKSSIPTATGSPRKNINFRDRECAATKMKPPIFTPCTNRRPQRELCPVPVPYNRESLCSCENPNRTHSKSTKPTQNDGPTTATNGFICYDQKPPIPARQQPGVSNAKTNARSPQTPRENKKNCVNKKTIAYPVIIKPMWYKDFKKTCQNIRKFQCLSDLGGTILKKKRSCRSEDDAPGGKKVKGKDNGSGESFEFEKCFLTLNGNKTIDVGNKTGFVWIPSSALQMATTESRLGFHDEVPQSENKVPNNGSHSATFFKAFNKRTTANVLTPKSCRLKPVQVNEKHPFRKLFEFRVCKSLSYLKSDQKGARQNEQPSDEVFGYESQKENDESPVSDDEKSEPVNWAFSSRLEDELLVGYSFTSESNVSADLLENGNLEDGQEAKTENELNFISPPRGQQIDLFSDESIESRSIDTFWFGSDDNKKEKKIEKLSW